MDAPEQTQPHTPEREALTPMERGVLERLGQVATLFSQMPVLHPADLEDAVFHVHAIQNLVLARAAYSKSARS